MCNQKGAQIIVKIRRKEATNKPRTNKLLL